MRRKQKKKARKGRIRKEGQGQRREKAESPQTPLESWDRNRGEDSWKQQQSPKTHDETWTIKEERRQGDKREKRNGTKRCSLRSREKQEGMKR